MGHIFLESAETIGNSTLEIGTISMRY